MTLTTGAVVSCVGRGITLIGTACFAVLASAAPIGEAEVKQCVQDILQRVGGGACSTAFSLESVKKVDARETSAEAFVIADIVFRVKTQIGGTSQAATQCTGVGWKGEVKNPYPPNSGQWLMFQSQADMSGGYLEPGQGLMVEKNFKFERWESGWRCAESQMSPISKTWFVNTPASAPSAGAPKQWFMFCLATGGAKPLLTEFLPTSYSDNKKHTDEFVGAHCGGDPAQCKCYGSYSDNMSGLNTLRDSQLKKGGQVIPWKPSSLR